MKLPFEVSGEYWQVFYEDEYKTRISLLMCDCPSENCIVIGMLSSPYRVPDPKTLTESTQLAVTQLLALSFAGKQLQRLSQL